MEAYEHSAQERESKIIRQLEHLKNYWTGKRNSDLAANFEKLCNKVGISPSTETDVNELLEKSSAPSPNLQPTS